MQIPLISNLMAINQEIKKKRRVRNPWAIAMVVIVIIAGGVTVARWLAIAVMIRRWRI
jgi:hypothetical protein